MPVKPPSDIVAFTMPNKADGYDRTYYRLGERRCQCGQLFVVTSYHKQQTWCAASCPVLRKQQGQTASRTRRERRVWSFVREIRAKQAGGKLTERDLVDAAYALAKHCYAAGAQYVRQQQKKAQAA